jgi:hypothetical protein
MPDRPVFFKSRIILKSVRRAKSQYTARDKDVCPALRSSSSYICKRLLFSFSLNRLEVRDLYITQKLLKSVRYCFSLVRGTTVVILLSSFTASLSCGCQKGSVVGATKAAKI